MAGAWNFASGKSQGLFVALVIALGVALSFAFALLTLPVAVSAIAGAVFLVLSVRRPVWGLAIFAGILTLEGIAAGRLGMTEVRLTGIAVFCIWIIHLVFYGKTLRVNKTFYAAVIFLIWAGVSFLWAEDPGWAGPYYGTLAQLVLLYLLIINVVESENDFRLVLAAMLIGAVATGFLSIQIFTANLFERARTFEAQNPNQYAAVVGLASVGGVYLAAQLKNKALRAGSFLLTCFLALPLVLAQSRTGWLAMLGALGVFIWQTKRRWRNLLIITGAATAIIVIIFTTGLINVTVIYRASDLMKLTQKGTNRFDIWRVASRIIYDHPIGGVGFMQFPVVYNRYRADTYTIRKDIEGRRDAHNVYFSVGAEMGLVGLALLFFIFWQALHEENLPPGARPWISTALLAYILIFSMGGSVYRLKFFWIALALAVKARSLAAARKAVPGEWS